MKPAAERQPTIVNALKELGFAPTGTTLVNTDARVLIDGTRCRKVSTESKWMSVRYAMARRAEEVEAIHLNKCPTELNFSDIVTKPLTGQLYPRHRAAVLGLLTLELYHARHGGRL